MIEQNSPDTKPLYVSNAAAEHLLSYIQQDPDAKGLRLTLKKYGCSGYAYTFESITTIDDNAVPVPLSQDLSIYIDKSAYPFLKGTEIDYVREGLNKKLTYNNPNQTGECGCGESFTVG